MKRKVPEEPFASWIFDASDGEVWYYEYDLSGRMTKSSSSKKGISGLTERASYAYDYRGLLVKKTYAEFTADEGVSITGGSTVKVTEWYEYTQDGRLLYTEKSAGSEVKKTDYIWAETTLWCEVDDGEVYYHHTDHLGTTETVTDSDGNIVWHAEYEAFGSVLSENGSMAFTPSFTGKMMDDCSGLYYFNARWYDSECGRFTTSDPIRDGVNFHNYCNGNPISFVDKDGNYSDDEINDFKDYVNNSMLMNYSDQKELGPYAGIEIPQINEKDAESFLNKEIEQNNYQERINKMTIQKGEKE